MPPTGHAGMSPSSNSDGSGPAYYTLLVLTVVAVVAGTIARFKGLGLAPFAVDEYYIARSVEFVLAHGLPQYDCGGLYTRGIILQYLTAGLRLLGLEAELAPRVVAAVSSLVALPAAFLIARRMLDRNGALIVVIILSLSVWDISMARFARMYAPFHALFLWHMVFVLRYTVDRDTRALLPMLICTVLGPFTWEGGVFLALANFIPPILFHRNGQLRREDWGYLAVAAILLAFSYWFATANLRILPGSWPPGYSPSMIESSMSSLDAIEYIGPRFSLLWMVTGLIALAAIAFSTRWIASFRPRWLTVAGLLAALLTAAAHQFILTAAALLLLPLVKLIDWREYLQRQALPYHASISLFVIGWLVYGALTFDWAGQGVGLRSLARMVYPYLQLPDVLAEVVRPWSQAVPVLGIVMLFVLFAAVVRLTLRPDEPITTERVILVTIVCMTLVAAASNPPRHETRYVFFVYALAIIIAVKMAERLSGVLRNRSPATSAWLTPLIALGVFAATEDFQPRYLARIDSHAAIFGEGMNPHFAEHLVSREDSRAIASWLRQNVGNGDIVINSYQSFDHYYASIDYFYMDQRDARFPGWACDAGRIERWRGLPLLYTDRALEEAILSGRHAYIINWKNHLERLLPRLAHLHPEIILTRGSVAVAKLSATTDD